MVAEFPVAAPTPICKPGPVCIVMLGMFDVITTLPTVLFCDNPAPVVNDTTPA